MRTTPTEILPVSSVAVLCKVTAILSFAASEQTDQFLPAMIRKTVLEHLKLYRVQKKSSYKDFAREHREFVNGH